MGSLEKEFMFGTEGKMSDFSMEDYIEDDSFLTEVPLNLMENSIITQFEDPFYYRKKDYVQDFMTKYERIKEDETQEDENDAESLKDEFILFMSKTFDKYLDIGLNDIEAKSEENQFDIIHYAYTFFIRRIKRNFVNIICNEMKKHTEEISSAISEKNAKNKNVTYSTFKDEIDDENIVNILSHSNAAVKIVLEKIDSTYSVDDFFQYCELDEPEIDKEYVEKCFNEFYLTGNFISKYVSMITEEFIIELEAKLRSHILKNFPNRKMKQVVKKEEKENKEANKEEAKS